MGLLVGLAVPHVERLEHVTAVGHPPSLDGRQEVIDVPAAVGRIERHAIDTLLPPGELGRVVARRLTNEHPRALGSAGAEVLERHGPVPAHRRRRVVGLVGGALDLGTSRHEQRPDRLLPREDAAGIRLLVPGRILARHPRLAPQRRRRTRKKRDVPFDLGIDHDLGLDDDPTLGIAPVAERHGTHTPRDRMLVDRHGMQIGEHREARETLRLPSRLGKEHMKGGEITLAVVAAVPAEPGGEARDDVVLQREPAQIPHRQVAVRIDRIGRQAADVARGAHHPDRGHPEPTRRDRGGRAGARASDHEQPRGVRVPCRDERMRLLGADDRRGDRNLADGQGDRRPDASSHGCSTGPFDTFLGERIQEGVPVPREPAWLPRAGRYAEAQAASRERRPGRPQPSSGNGARAAPTHGNPGWTTPLPKAFIGCGRSIVRRSPRTCHDGVASVAYTRQCSR